MMHTSIPRCAAALASVFCLAAAAQDKTDGLWRGSGGAALSATSGNTSTSSLLVTAEAVRATTTDKTSLGATVNRAKNRTGGASQTTADRWALLGQYDYNLSPRVYGFGKLGFEADKLIDLDLRASLAAGLGYKVISTPETAFDVLAGGAYTRDKYGLTQTINGKTDTRFSRASVYFGESSSHKLSPTVTFKQRLDLYPGISGDKAVLAKFTAGLAVAISSTLNLTVGLTDNYNSKPPAGTKANDVGLFTGINVKFGAI